MSAAEGAPPRREALLRAALRAYPAIDRQEYGDDLLDAASDLAASGSTLREVGGLMRGGAQARVRRGRAGLLAFDRTAAGDFLVEPLTSLVVAIWGAAAIVRILGETGGPESAAQPGVTAGSALLLTALAVLTIAVARRQRSLATGASVVLLAQITVSAGWSQWRGDIVTAAPQLHLHVGPWWFGPSLVWSLVPFVALLVACCAVMTPAGPRLPGLQRAPREWSATRLLALLSPSVMLGSVLALRPSLLIDMGGSRETTELPGLLFLMLVVASFWLATSSPPGRDHWSAAGALIGLAAVPSVAYGFADLISPGLGAISAPTVRLGLVLLFSSGVVVLCLTVFLAALSSVGLRTGAGAPPHGAVD